MMLAEPRGLRVAVAISFFKIVHFHPEGRRCQNAFPENDSPSVGMASSACTFPCPLCFNLG